IRDSLWLSHDVVDGEYCVSRNNARMQLGYAIGPPERHLDCFSSHRNRESKIAGAFVAIREVGDQPGLGLKSHTRLAAQSQRLSKQIGGGAGIARGRSCLSAIAQCFNAKIR